MLVVSTYSGVTRGWFSGVRRLQQLAPDREGNEEM